jgi:arsenate reductase (thioredoxin)
MSEHAYNVLFLCTGNSARSIVAALRYLKSRISVFTSLPLRSIDKLSPGKRLRDIGRGEGAPTLRPDVA